MGQAEPQQQPCRTQSTVHAPQIRKIPARRNNQSGLLFNCPVQNTNEIPPPTVVTSIFQFLRRHGICYTVQGSRTAMEIDDDSETGFRRLSPLIPPKQMRRPASGATSERFPHTPRPRPYSKISS